MRAIIAVLLVTLFARTAATQVPGTVLDAIRDRAAHQFSLAWLLTPSLASTAPSGAIDAKHVVAVEVDAPFTGMRLFQVDQPGGPHSNPILLGYVSGEVLALGGAGEVQLLELMKLLKVRVQDERSALRVAENLSRLADPNGSTDFQSVGKLCGGADSSMTPAVSPLRHLTNSSYRRPWGGMGVRVATCSRDRARLDTWTRILFAFEFNDSGELVAWRSSP